MDKIKAAEVCALISFILIISGLLSEENIYCISGFIVSIFSLRVKDKDKDKKHRIQL